MLSWLVNEDIFKENTEINMKERHLINFLISLNEKGKVRPDVSILTRESS